MCPVQVSKIVRLFRLSCSGETGVLAKGERGQTIIETSVKTVGLDPSGGQGLGNGMNHFSNSQSGSQQPIFFSWTRAGVAGT